MLLTLDHWGHLAGEVVFIKKISVLFTLELIKQYVIQSHPSHLYTIMQKPAKGGRMGIGALKK